MLGFGYSQITFGRVGGINKAMNLDSLRERLAAVPERPGVYLLRDAKGQVIYVGKAAGLRARLRTYFQDAHDSVKLEQLAPRIADFEYILTESAHEALLLENLLIKEHQPRFNVRLRDDKTYPYLKVDLSEPFPRVFITRRVENDGARYFGPYSSTSSVRRTLELVKRLFPYRSCNRLITGNDPRPCLDFYISRCVGPCIGAASEDDYARVIEQVILFLEGKQTQVVAQIKRQMKKASDALAFERAAQLRDQVRAVERSLERQRVVAGGGENADAIAFAQDGDEACVQVFYMRGGNVVGSEPYFLSGVQGEEPSAILASFVQQFYATVPTVPPRLLLQHAPSNADDLATWLASRRNGAVRLAVPQRGRRRRLIELVAENARESLAQRRARWLADRSKTAAAMSELQEALALPRLPQRIECYDISNIMGTNAVGSMVVFENGRPKRAHYRRFQIKWVEGIDDYAMMREMLRRRFHRMAAAEREAHESLQVAGEVTTTPPALRQVEEEDAFSENDVEPDNRESPQATSFGAVPDLVLIDGGQGHLSAALDVLRDLGLTHLPTAALAKEREEVYQPFTIEPLLLPRTSQALYLLQRLRDEAHRFAITYHRQRRSKGALVSTLDSIAGIGPARRRALLRRFGSVEGVRKATLEELLSLPGMTRPVAERLQAALGG